MDIYLQTEESVTTVALNELAPPDVANSAFLEGLGLAIDETQPHLSAPIYALTVDQLTNACGDPVPGMVGWYFVATDATGIIAGEVPSVPDGPGCSRPLTSLTFGQLVDQTWKAFGLVKEHPELQAQPFDLRWLRLAGLGVEAFWLKASPFDARLCQDDRVYAFLAFQADLKDQLLPASDFLKIARKLAAARLLIDNSPKLP